MVQINKLIHKAIRLIRKNNINDLWNIIIYKLIKKNYYIHKNRKHTKWAIVSYVEQPFYYKKDLQFMMGHQTRREALEMGNILESLGYNYVIENYESKPRFLNKKFDLIFGHEPNFIQYANNNPKAIKIIYSAGTYFVQRNNSIKNRTDFYNSKHGTNIKYLRLIEPHNGFDIADKIFQIGNPVTIETFPQHLRQKIKLINQSSNFIGKCDIDEKIKNSQNNEFVWMGSVGSILKGLDLVLDYFLTRPDLRLSIIGKIDDDVYEYYKDSIEKAAHIKYYGFVDVNTDYFKNIITNASFIIFPSATEGCPGAVISLMQNGLIPIVSKICSFPEVEEMGYVIKAISQDGIEDSVEWAISLPEKDRYNMQRKAYEYSTNKWSINTFKHDFREGIIYIINKTSH